MSLQYPDAMRIQPAEASDAQVIADVYNSCSKERIVHLSPVYNHRYVSADDVREWLREDGSLIFTASEQDEILGYCHTRIITDVGDRPVEVGWIRPVPEWELGQSNIAVMEPVRRRGIGQSLLLAAVDHFRESSVEVVEALSFSDSTAAEELFRNTGFSSNDIFHWHGYSLEKPLANSSVYASLNLEDFNPMGHTDSALFQEANQDDAEEIALIHRENVWWCKECATAAWSRKYIAGAFGHRVYVCEKKDEVVGCIDYLPNGRIGIAGVLTKYKQQGIGTTMLNHLLGEMKKAGLNEAFVDSGMTQTEAISLCERMGFSVQRHQHCWVKILQEIGQ